MALKPGTMEPSCVIASGVSEEMGALQSRTLMGARKPSTRRSMLQNGDLYTKPQTCCRCESVHAAVPAMAENPLELRRLLPAPGGLCATGSEIPATVPKLAFPRTLLPSRESIHPSPRLKRSGLRQSFDVAAKRKHPEVHAVHGTRDSSHSCSGRMYNYPGCNTAESATLSPSSL